MTCEAAAQEVPAPTQAAGRVALSRTVIGLAPAAGAQAGSGDREFLPSLSSGWGPGPEGERTSPGLHRRRLQPSGLHLKGAAPAPAAASAKPRPPKAQAVLFLRVWASASRFTPKGPKFTLEMGIIPNGRGLCVLNVAVIQGFSNQQQPHLLGTG